MADTPRVNDWAAFEHESRIAKCMAATWIRGDIGLVEPYLADDFGYVSFQIDSGSDLFQPFRKDVEEFEEMEATSVKVQYLLTQTTPASDTRIPDWPTVWIEKVLDDPEEEEAQRKVVKVCMKISDGKIAEVTCPPLDPGKRRIN